MRALADRLDVKAASLYWHVRDRRELLELVAESFLDAVPPPQTRTGWRAAFIALASALGDEVAGQNDAARLIVEVPEVLMRSDVYRRLRGQLASAGLPSADASDL